MIKKIYIYMLLTLTSYFFNSAMLVKHKFRGVQQAPTSWFGGHTTHNIFLYIYIFIFLFIYSHNTITYTHLYTQYFSIYLFFMHSAEIPWAKSSTVWTMMKTECQSMGATQPRLLKSADQMNSESFSMKFYPKK